MSPSSVSALHLACILSLGCAGRSADTSKAVSDVPCVPAPAAATPADDLLASFSSLQNPSPSGHFSYGFQRNRWATFEAFAARGTILGSASWQVTETPLLGCPGTCSLPAIWKNETSSVQTVRSLNVPPGVVVFHPGAEGELSVVRWTAPSAGTFRASAWFDPLDDTTTNVAVVLNGVEPPLLAAKVSREAAAIFERTLPLRAGDTLDFTVGVGENGDYAFDSTGIQIVIDPV